MTDTYWKSPDSKWFRSSAGIWCKASSCPCHCSSYCIGGNNVSSVIANLGSGGLTNNHCSQCTTIAGYYNLNRGTSSSCKCHWRYLESFCNVDVWPGYLMVDAYPAFASSGHWRWRLAVYVFYRWHALTEEQFVNYASSCGPPGTGTNSGYQVWRYVSDEMEIGEECKPSGGEIAVSYDVYGISGGLLPCTGTLGNELALLIT